MVQDNLLHISCAQQEGDSLSRVSGSTFFQLVFIFLLVRLLPCRSHSNSLAHPFPSINRLITID